MGKLLGLMLDAAGGVVAGICWLCSCRSIAGKVWRCRVGAQGLELIYCSVL